MTLLNPRYSSYMGFGSTMRKLCGPNPVSSSNSRLAQSMSFSWRFRRPFGKPHSGRSYMAVVASDTMRSEWVTPSTTIPRLKAWYFSFAYIRWLDWLFFGAPLRGDHLFHNSLNDNLLIIFRSFVDMFLNSVFAYSVSSLYVLGSSLVSI